MSEDRSRDSQSGSSLTLPRSKILRGRRNFQRLFEKATTFRATTVDLRFRIYDDPEEQCLIGFIAKKKLGKAVKRNRIKRQMREAYRINQHQLTGLFESGKFGLHGVFMATSIEMDFNTVEDDIVYLMKRLRDFLTTSSGQVS